MKRKGVTKAEVQVLYQIDAGITDPEEIADILSREPKEVKAAIKGLREKKLIRAGRVTEAGKSALERYHRWVFG